MNEARCCAVLLGPLRAITYFFMHGALALCLGTFWRWRVHWSLSVAAAALVRLVGQLCYFLITCWIIDENLYQLLLANCYSILVSLIRETGYLQL